MRILLTNDDGIGGPGLAALAECLDGLGELWIVAPDQDRSGTGHAITVREHLRVQRIRLAGRWESYAVAGTPADCVKLALLELCPGPPDLVVAGINAGANLGIDVFYSGTVAAALEGALMGLPSIAVSCITDKQAPRFEAAQKVVPVLASWMMTRDTRLAAVLNVNVPEGAFGGAEAIRWTRLGLKRRYRDWFERHAQGDGDHHFRLMGDADEADQDDPSTDAGAVHHNFISVTPVHFDLTDYSLIEELGAAPGGRFEVAGRAASKDFRRSGASQDGRTA